MALPECDMAGSDRVEQGGDFGVLIWMAAEPGNRDVKAVAADVELERIAIDDKSQRRLAPKRYLSPYANNRVPRNRFSRHVDAAVLLIEAHGPRTRGGSIGEKIPVIQPNSLSVACGARRHIDDDARNAAIGMVANQFPKVRHLTLPFLGVRQRKRPSSGKKVVDYQAGRRGSG